MFKRNKQNNFDWIFISRYTFIIKATYYPKILTLWVVHTCNLFFNYENTIFFYLWLSLVTQSKKENYYYLIWLSENLVLENLKKYYFVNL